MIKVNFSRLVTARVFLLLINVTLLQTVIGACYKEKKYLTSLCLELYFS